MSILYCRQCNNFIGIVFMKKEFKKVEVKEVYLAPVCECIEISSEGVLCGSTFTGDGAFGSEDNDFVGEWSLFE